ncbi:hypothetical protein ZIOFF_037826 [Zingiber officinale]|uniref:Uncharacterized protein n=1 Tax=Zingiber officinale TaxID=94328 RepID=A0A8J5GC43_ZINOF|nr:hypothetical protein ZIOFF_037826 [Zingiber officinale]
MLDVQARGNDFVLKLKRRKIESSQAIAKHTADLLWFIVSCRVLLIYGPLLRKIESSQATAKHTAELLRQVVSQQRITYTNQATSLIDVVKVVDEQLIKATPIGRLCYDFPVAIPRI